MNPVLEEIYASNSVMDPAGNRIEVHSQITKKEGTFLAGIIQQDPAVKTTLEVGCAYGLSSLFICSELASRPGAHHTILDPNQATHWMNVGVENLRRAGYHDFTLIPDYSQFALPQLAREKSGTFDFIFIDGWHTFDHTLLDIFYANLLLKVGGYLVIDDTDSAPIAKAISYLSLYPAYRVVRTCSSELSWRGRLASKLLRMVPQSLIPASIASRYGRWIHPTMVAFQKIEEDKRSWSWYEEF